MIGSVPPERWIYVVLANISLFALGASIVTMGILTWFRPYRWWAFLLVKAGLFGIIGLIYILLLPVGRLQVVDWKIIVYTTCVLFTAIGQTFVIKALIKMAVDKDVTEIVKKTIAEHENGATS